MLGADGSIISLNLFVYCDNNPVMRSDPTGHFSWTNVFNTAAIITAAAMAVVAIISSGGTAAPPIIAAASAIAGSAVTTTTVVAAAAGVAVTGIAAMGVATTAYILEAKNDQGKDYVSPKNNKTANKWAQEFGYNNAEALKEDYVGRSSVSKFNICMNKTTREIILVGIKIAVEVATGLIRMK